MARVAGIAGIAGVTGRGSRPTGSPKTRVARWGTGFEETFGVWAAATAGTTRIATKGISLRSMVLPPSSASVNARPRPLRRQEPRQPGEPVPHGNCGVSQVGGVLLRALHHFLD